MERIGQNAQFKVGKMGKVSLRQTKYRWKGACKMEKMILYSGRLHQWGVKGLWLNLLFI